MMEVFEGLESITKPFAASTVAVGTFDGVHRGHQAIIRAAIADARAQGRPALVFTFDRHPAEHLAPERVPGYLTTPAQRIRLLREIAPEGLVMARFDRAFSELSPEAFVSDVLKGLLGAQAVVVGSNFLFGKGRTGNVAYLESVQERFGFVLHALEPVFAEGAPASSTRVRELLREGDVEKAERILGHPFWLQGMVVSGQKLGRQLGYPTANLMLTIRQAVPADGIYAVRVRLDDGRLFGGACSIGNRPTIEGAGRSIETFLFDFSEDIYGREMEIQFVRRLREELKFSSLEALISQIEQDVIEAKQILSQA